MNLLINTLNKLGFSTRSRLPPDPRIDGHHLFLLRISEVVRLRSLGPRSLLHPRSAHLLDVPGLRHEGLYLFPRSFGVALWSADLRWVLEQEAGRAGRTRLGRYFHRHRHDHPVHARRLGPFRRRISRHGRQRRLSHERCRSTRRLVLSAQARRRNSEIRGQPQRTSSRNGSGRTKGSTFGCSPHLEIRHMLRPYLVTDLHPSGLFCRARFGNAGSLHPHTPEVRDGRTLLR